MRELTGPEARAAVSLSTIGSGISTATWDATALLEELREQSKDVNGGDLSRAEQTLAAQANVLDALFHALLRRGFANMEAGYGDAAERYMRLGLKSQSQSRATLETLAALRNPPLILARQANFTTGPQQVNNGIPASRAREIKNAQNELLRESHSGEWLDTGAKGKASGADPQLATLDKGDGA